MDPLTDVSPPLNFDKWYSLQDINAFAPSYQNMHFCPPLNKIVDTAWYNLQFLFCEVTMLLGVCVYMYDRYHTITRPDLMHTFEGVKYMFTIFF